MEKLKEYLASLGKVAIAYSGGIDSSFLLFVANQVLPKENVVAVLAKGRMMAQSDYEEAIDFVRKNGFSYQEVLYEPLKVKEFRENRKNRCYACKKNLMRLIKKVSEEKGFSFVLDGKNADDLKVYRPGNKAAEELGIISPLAEFGFCKNEIREKSQELGIEIWNKPSNSCLATRFPYDTVLTKENLKKVEHSEAFIKNLGISKVRVRVHGEIARIEVEKRHFEVILQNEMVMKQIKNLGFQFVVLDLEDLRSGSFD